MPEGSGAGESHSLPVLQLAQHEEAAVRPVAIGRALVEVHGSAFAIRVAGSCRQFVGAKSDFMACGDDTAGVWAVRAKECGPFQRSWPSNAAPSRVKHCAASFHASDVRGRNTRASNGLEVSELTSIWSRTSVFGIRI